MLLDIYNASRLVKGRHVNFQTPSPYDHSRKDYVYTSIGEPFCRNMPYNTWYVRQYKYPEKSDLLGSCWEEYLQDQIYFLRYNNPNISKLAVSIVIDLMKSWGINGNVFKDKDLTEHISELYDSYSPEWEPKEVVRHWYSISVEKLPKEDDESLGEYNKRKVSLKASLRAQDKSEANQEIIKTASLDYQTQKHGLVPTVDILTNIAQKSLHLVKKLGAENEDWQRRGAFTEQCLSIALELNSDFTQKELAEIVSNELPNGMISERGVKAIVKRLNSSNYDTNKTRTKE